MILEILYLKDANKCKKCHIWNEMPHDVKLRSVLVQKSNAGY